VALEKSRKFGSEVSGMDDDRKSAWIPPDMMSIFHAGISPAICVYLIAISHTAFLDITYLYSSRTARRMNR